MTWIIEISDFYAYYGSMQCNSFPIMNDFYLMYILTLPRVTDFYSFPNLNLTSPIQLDLPIPSTTVQPVLEKTHLFCRSASLVYV